MYLLRKKVGRKVSSHVAWHKTDCIDINAVLHLTDNDTTQFLFTETIPFPPTSSIFLNALDSEDASDPFQVFKGALQKRLDGRPPVLDFCLCSIERTAEQISADVLAWLSASETAGANINQRAQYLDSAQAALWSLQETLSRTLNNENIDTSQQLIVGDLALHLVKESHVVKTLLLGEKQTSAGFIKALMDVEQQSRKAWLEKAVGNAVEVYRRGVLDSFVVPVLPNASSECPFAARIWHGSQLMRGRISRR